ncbi:hypothetical protein GCM10017673_16840 [Streptosporangium violaceochromogenes]|nr:hypothetical protein GCM10017673_16840 [Streptosporangium violaceochromogenes]
MLAPGRGTHARLERRPERLAAGPPAACLETLNPAETVRSSPRANPFVFTVRGVLTALTKSRLKLPRRQTDLLNNFTAETGPMVSGPACPPDFPVVWSPPTS